MWLDNGFFHPIQLCHTFWLYTAQKMKFSIKCFFSKCNQISRKLRIWSHLLKKSSMENFIFLAVLTLHLLAMLILIFFLFYDNMGSKSMWISCYKIFFWWNLFRQRKQHFKGMIFFMKQLFTTEIVNGQ